MQTAKKKPESSIKRLERRVKALEVELTKVRDLLPEEEVIVLRELSKEEAKQEIRDLFTAGGTWYYSDIVRRLKLDAEMVVDICNELMEEGEIGVSTS